MPCDHLRGSFSIALLAIALIALAPGCRCGSGGVGDACSSNADCDAGLFCDLSLDTCVAGPDAGLDAAAPLDSAVGVDSAVGADSGTGMGTDSAPPPVDAGVCDPALTPPGDRTCPAVCTGGCHDANTLCQIDCAGVATCDGATIDCPPNYACLVICTGTDACDTATVNCPALYGCQVTCGGMDGCGDVAIVCGSGACSVACGGDPASCAGTTVQCGAGPCSAMCEGTSTPVLDGCASACDCTSC